MKRMLTFVLVCCLLVSGGALAKDKKLRDMDVVLDWYPNALHAFIYVAMERGYYEQKG